MHFVNGFWVEDRDAVISVFDLSVVRGFGVFDFLRTYNNKPFRLSEHLDRLMNSAMHLGLRVPYSKKEMQTFIMEGLEKNKYPEKNVRIVVTGGVSEDSVTPGDPSFYILFSPALSYPDNYYTSGVKVITYPFIRTVPQAKTLNYMAALIALQKAKSVAGVEAIYTGTKGEIFEGTTSNFFAVMNGVLITPKNGILGGITRDIVIRIAKKQKLTVKERTVHTQEIPLFDEVFITASNKEVMPVVTIDDTLVGKGNVGPITQKIYAFYKQLTQTQ